MSKSFVRYTSATISAGSSRTHEIARQVSLASGKDFNTSEKGRAYFLSNDKFQVDDKYWRRHVGLLFDLMLEQGLIKKGGKIYVQVDFTTSRDKFLILSASLIVNNRAIPLYFSLRNYPKKAGCFNQKKREAAFLKGLKHCLSKRYKYVLVADRGFGNRRFMALCRAVGFDYINSN